MNRRSASSKARPAAAWARGPRRSGRAGTTAGRRRRSGGPHGRGRAARGRSATSSSAASRPGARGPSASAGPRRTGRCRPRTRRVVSAASAIARRTSVRTRCSVAKSSNRSERRDPGCRIGEILPDGSILVPTPICTISSRRPFPDLDMHVGCISWRADRTRVSANVAHVRSRRPGSPCEARVCSRGAYGFRSTDPRANVHVSPHLAARPARRGADATPVADGSPTRPR